MYIYVYQINDRDGGQYLPPFAVWLLEPEFNGEHLSYI